MALHPLFQDICEAHGAVSPEKELRVWQNDEFTVLYVRDRGGAQTTLSLTRKEVRSLISQLRNSVRQNPVVPTYWNGVGKYSSSFGFEPGLLNVNIDGYGTSNGDGILAFKEDDLEFEQDDGPLYRYVNIANSELLELRDHLNSLFPPEASPTPSPTRHQEGTENDPA